MKEEYNLATVTDIKEFEKDPATEFFSDKDRAVRNRLLYAQELKKGVELGRKLGKFERRFGKMRAEVTDYCAAMALLNPSGLESHATKVLRNTVRIMKGKNPWK